MYNTSQYANTGPSQYLQEIISYNTIPCGHIFSRTFLAAIAKTSELSSWQPFISHPSEIHDGHYKLSY